MKKLIQIGLLTTIAILVLGGCTNSSSTNIYRASNAGVASRVSKGIIVSKRMVKIEGNSGVGSIAGGIAGGAAGSTIGGSGAANVVGAVGGAVAAGIIGHELDQAINRKTGYEYIIKLKNGKTISVAQDKSIPLAIGQKVLIIYGATTRVIPDHPVHK